ncbi:leucine-rich repeat-containing protein 7 isoform X7 [Chiloscyllium plagiosum]|nr:leucine-rich repeat-containing protein 7 isoform X7 [Chiloscyllium plagiosum]XP_043555283.1 leucine-rich repeat-containing protein 7 isoform X7 [Chiloscyllium plagiosum]XP_043555284.1 leucine-rich repeat-containing protein 7 isoform X7 [Chiloscyllium plagiosum]XP_043555285.1 leucine-rich repeat-containing protein 7 isoform X7 [Chiloscyllium plagiosum]XP_043555286.1 leucine-rich repeat-containing protein 7 isoform X7 [Chiloscyllium plagiosum]
MTTKRKLIGRLVPCRCFRGEEEVISVLDYSHCSLQHVPKEIFNFERSLEELYLDANQIEELPKQLFNCQALRKLSVPDNDLSNLPTTIASLVNLRELDISKNGIQDFPENIKCCKYLSVIEASVNPISKLPDGFTQLLNLMQLYLNDAFLEFLPANFGRLTKLRILELRENHLKTLPKSMHRLTQIDRLDLGSNEFTELPEVLEQLQSLKELWMDNNSIQTLPGPLAKLKHLTYLDMSKNRIEMIESDISGCEGLEDLLLSSNLLQQLPDTIGILKKLTTLKVDDNQLNVLPNAIGGLSVLEEFDCSCNELESLPHTIGYLHNLRTFAADENFLVELPREIGSCKNVTVMSLRSNKLERLPEEIGQMQKLKVLNLSDNRLKNLPFSFTKLKELAALWLSDNQSKALIPLQTESHPETKQRVLTNYMFPQQPRNDEVEFPSDSDSFNPTLWEEQRQQRMQVAFEFEEKKEEEDDSGKVKVEINLKRYPTPYPEDLKNMVKSVQHLVGKHSQEGSEENSTGATNIEHSAKDKYEHKWPISAKDVTLERSLGDSPNDLRMGELRPTLSETPLFKPKVVLLSKEKKESTDESEGDRINNSGSSASYSDYSPSQGSSASSGVPIKVSTLQTAVKDGVAASSWGNSRLTQTFQQNIEAKPLLSQREAASTASLQQRNERRPMNETFSDKWNDNSHYDNTGFVAEESTSILENPSANPLISTKSRSTSAHGRRPLMRQDRIIGVPLELEQSMHTLHSVRNTPETEVPPSNPWQNWTRTPSPFEDRTAFPSKLESTPFSSPIPDRKDSEQQSVHGITELPSPFISGAPWSFLNSRESNLNRSHADKFSHICRPESAKSAIIASKSTERLAPMMRSVKAGQFKKSQSIDEIDIGAFKIYNIPLDSYGSSSENPGSIDIPEQMPTQEQGMSRSLSAPMLDEDLSETYGSGKISQRVPITKKVYHFDQSFNPQGTINVKPERRVTTSFTHNVDYGVHQNKNVSKDLISPRSFRGYQPVEQMYSFSQPSVNDEPANPRFSSQGDRAGYLRRGDSLATSTEMMLHRRVNEASELSQNERYVRTHFRGVLEHQNSASLVESQYLKRNGRYEEDYSTFQDIKSQGRNFQDKPLTQRRPLSARSYSTESYGFSQTRPVSARPTMAALLEKLPSDYNISNYNEKPSESNDIRIRSSQLKGDENSAKIPLDWRQQLLRHIEAKRLDRTPSQQSNVHDSELEDISPTSQWSTYALGRRDVPPESIVKKLPESLPNGLNYPQAGSHPHQGQSALGSSPQSLQHRPREQQYEGAVSKVTLQQYQKPLQIAISSSQNIASPRATQPSRCLTSIKPQKSTESYQEQFCVRIEKNPGLGFSISGGISGQGNPFKPSDMVDASYQRMSRSQLQMVKGNGGIFVTRVQPDGPASNLLQPGDKILKANGHNFTHMEHEKAVSLLKSFQNTVDLIIQREIPT